MGITKKSLDLKILNNRANLDKVNDYICSKQDGGHRIFKGDFTGFSLFDLVMMLGFTAMYSKEPDDVIKISKLSCYDNDQHELICMLNRMERI